MQALLIEATEERLGDVWDLLGESAHCYDDNGGAPDGPAWLPRDPDQMEDEAVRAVVTAGLGRLVEVRLASDEALAGLAGLGPLSDELREDRDMLAALLQGGADEKTETWAHYGAYGALDSRWVLVPRGESAESKGGQGS